MIARRRTLLGLGATLFAPAIIRTPGLLMSVKAAPVVVGSRGIKRLAMARDTDVEALLASAQRAIEAGWMVHLYLLDVVDPIQAFEAATWLDASAAVA